MWLTKFFNISIWKNILFLQVLFISLLVFSFHRNCYKGTNADFNLSWQKTEVLKEGSKNKLKNKQYLNTKIISNKFVGKKSTENDLIQLVLVFSDYIKIDIDNHL